MPDGELIGEVFVRVLPDMDRFRADLEAGLAAALRGGRAVVPVEADTTAATRRIARVRAQASKRVDMAVDADVAPADAAVATMQAKAAETVTTPVVADTGAMLAEVEAARAAASEPLVVPVTYVGNRIGEPVGSVSAGMGADIGANVGAQIAEALGRGLGTGTNYNLGEQIARGLDLGLGTGQTESLGRQIVSALLSAPGAADAASGAYRLGALAPEAVAPYTPNWAMWHEPLALPAFTGVEKPPGWWLPPPPETLVEDVTIDASSFEAGAAAVEATKRMPQPAGERAGDAELGVGGGGWPRAGTPPRAA